MQHAASARAERALHLPPNGPFLRETPGPRRFSRNLGT